MALEDQSPEITTPEPATTDAQQTVETATDVTQEPAPSATEADDAAFLQGFEGAEPEATAKPEPEPEPQPEPEPEPPKFAGKTEAEILEMFERVSQFSQREAKMFGTLGSLKQQVEAVKAQSQGAKLSKENFKRLTDEYPDVAEALLEGLSSAQLAQSGVDPQEIARLAEQIAMEQTTQVERKFESRLLTVKHPDWKEVVTSEQYDKWKSALPDADRNQLDNSWDSDFIGQKLSEFKDWKSKTVQTKQSNQRRLEAAIAPRGNPQKPPSLSPEEEFIKGFNSLGPVR